MIDVLASRPNYWRHLAPVVAALGEHVGTVAHRPGQMDRHSVRPLLVAGGSELGHVLRDRPVALLEHGAGQTYVGLDHRSWAGGAGRDKVGMFLVPRREVADVNLARYPDAEAAVVGCPALDAHPPRVRTGRTVAFTFHPDYPAATQVPELKGALPHFLHHLGRIVATLEADGWRVVGHWHPRFRGLRNVWRRLGVELVEDWDDVLASADVLVADNTSALPEAAAVGLGTVWLRAPWWRDDCGHGGRFWEWERFGVACADPDGVVEAVGRCQGGDPTAARCDVFTFCDNRPARRAADALLAWGG